MEIIMKPPISTARMIGIAGLNGAGKDTAANIIMAQRPSQLRRYSFATPLKKGVKAMFGWTDDIIEDRHLKEMIDPWWGFTPRKAMQLLGTEYGRLGLREDIWLIAAARYHETTLAMGASTIITDLRFENEAKWVRETPGSVVIHIKDPEMTETGSHESEKGIETLPGDIVIFNDKRLGIERLHEQIMAHW